MMFMLLQAASSPATAPNPFMQVPFIIAIVGIFYFLLIRPQKKRVKEHKAMLASVQRGDKVVTAGGLIGKVVKVEEGELTVDLGSGNKVKVVASMLTDVLNKTASANDTKAKK
ncbi:MAG: preprotein translocase subunit YajC [Robiginitomaculum sp.]